jgi:arginine repressor
VVPFVRRVRQAGPYQLFIVTAPGAGRAVTQSITESEWEEIVGIIEGDSGVLILTENFFFQRLLYERLKYFLGAAGAGEIVEMG